MITGNFPSIYPCKRHAPIPVVRFILMGIALSTAFSHAQPAKGANKFLGNITTNGSVRSDFSLYWNQITGENESKWMTIEGTRDSMNWTGADRIAAYARAQGIPWKFHSLITGGTYPNWIASLTDAELLEEIAEWMDSAAQRYPDVTMIDVVNEAYPAHF